MSTTCIQDFSRQTSAWKDVVSFLCTRPVRNPEFSIPCQLGQQCQPLNSATLDARSSNALPYVLANQWYRWKWAFGGLRIQLLSKRTRPQWLERATAAKFWVSGIKSCPPSLNDNCYCWYIVLKWAMACLIAAISQCSWTMEPPSSRGGKSVLSAVDLCLCAWLVIQW